MTRLSRKAKHKRRGKRATAVTGPTDDDGQPLLSDQDAPTAGDAGDTASADKPTAETAPAPDSGGNDKPESTPKDDPKPDKSDGKTEGKKDGKKDGRKDDGGDKTPPPADPSPDHKNGGAGPGDPA